MPFYVEILFGKEQVRKIQLDIKLTDYRNLINYKKYEFENLKERNSFYKGLEDSNGWIEFEIIKENETTFNNEEELFDYWSFIVKYYPNYEHCDSILLSDILTRKLDGEEICKKDEEYIKNWDIRKVLMELDKELLGVAFENYFNLTFPENK